MGYCLFLRDDANLQKSWILSLGVHPTYQKLGIGRDLSINAIEQLTLLRVSEIFLTVVPNNRNVINLYSSLKFKNDKFLPDHFGIGNNRQRMKLVIKS